MMNRVSYRSGATTSSEHSLQTVMSWVRLPFRLDCSRQWLISSLGGVLQDQGCNHGPVTPTALRAPELSLRDSWNAGINVWALGCLIFELATKLSCHSMLICFRITAFTLVTGRQKGWFSSPPTASSAIVSASSFPGLSQCPFLSLSALGPSARWRILSFRLTRSLDL
ncbi:hypothetical protein BJX65DRAFT_35664 [Aspergillus insuetus]